MDRKDIKILLLRGINVGGKNKVPMADLRQCLRELGYPDALTYIASGNVALGTDESCEGVRSRIEAALPRFFDLDDESIKVLVLTREKLRSVIEDKPEGFGDRPDEFHSDVLFLIDIEVDRVMPVFKPREGVDTIWPGDGVVYSQRLSAQRTKSRLSQVMGTPEYKQMTIRNWNTTMKLMEMADNLNPS